MSGHIQLPMSDVHLLMSNGSKGILIATLVANILRLGSKNDQHSMVYSNKVIIFSLKIIVITLM
jgi:hypothetical protein